MMQLWELSVLLSDCIKQIPGSSEFTACLKSVCLDRFYMLDSDRRKKAIYKCQLLAELNYIPEVTYLDTYVLIIA